jgi:hypothetical protein
MTMLTDTVRVQHAGAIGRADSTLPMPVPLRRVLLLAPPLALAALEILHPQPDENRQALMEVRGGEAGRKASRSRGAP